MGGVLRKRWANMDGYDFRWLLAHIRLECGTLLRQNVAVWRELRFERVRFSQKLRNLDNRFKCRENGIKEHVHESFIVEVLGHFQLSNEQQWSVIVDWPTRGLEPPWGARSVAKKL